MSPELMGGGERGFEGISQGSEMQMNADNSNDKFVFCLVCSYRLLFFLGFFFVFLLFVLLLDSVLLLQLPPRANNH